VRGIVRGWMPVLAAALLPALPHYLIHGRYIVNYIRDVAFGATATMAAMHTTWQGHLLFHLNDPRGGGQMLGTHLYIFAAVVALGCATQWQRRGRAALIRAVCYGVVVAAAFAIPLVHGEKQMFFAVAFDFLLLLGAVVALRQLAVARGGAALLVAALLA